MGLSRTSGPTFEPIDVDDVQRIARIDDDYEQDLLNAYITAAREYAERVAQYRTIGSSVWRLTRDRFPGGRGEILLPMPPAVSIVSVQYRDDAGTLVTVASSDYYLDATSEPARLVPAVDACWPCAGDLPGAVIVNWNAGYATAGAVPQSTKTAIAMLAAHWYRYREPVQKAPLMKVPLHLEVLFEVDSVKGLHAVGVDGATW